MFGKSAILVQKLGKWLWVIVIFAILVIWRIIATSNSTIKVETIKVISGNILETVSTSGTVKADRYAQLTFPSGGQVIGVGVKQGDTVKKGQFIAQIDTVVLNAAYQNALNTYRGTRAAVDLEHDNDKNYGSGETFTQRNTRTAAEVANDNAYNNVLAAQQALKNAVIFAPFDGVMDTVNPSSPGINLIAATANYTIVDPSSVYFDAEVEETDLPRVSVGQKVNLKLDAYPDSPLQGEVSVVGLIAFISSTGGNAYHIRIFLPDNSSMRFRVGMQGDADIIFGTVQNVTKVSSSAIFTDAEKSYVWIISGGKVKKTLVTAGATSIDETEIKSGLNPDETVVDNPPSNLKDGQRVKI